MPIRPLMALVLLLTLPVAAARADPPPAPAIRYLALGDSFTIGTGSSPAQAFPARLAARWEGAGRRVVLRNLAVNGYTTQDLIEDELPAVRAFAPSFVTLAIGANDLVRGGTPARYRAQLRRIFALLQADGVPASRVVVLPQPDWSQSPVAAAFGTRAELAARIRVFNEVIREETLAVGARFVDLFPLMERQAGAGLIAPDGLHPSAAAHDEWAAALARALDGILEQAPRAAPRRSPRRGVAPRAARQSTITRRAATRSGMPA